MFDKALELNQALGRKEGMAIDYGNLGTVYLVRGELSQAEEMFDKALELNQALGSKEGMARDSFNLGLLYKAQHRYPAAKRVFEQSRQYHSGFLPPDHDRFQMIEKKLLEIQSTLKNTSLVDSPASAFASSTARARAPAPAPVIVRDSEEQQLMKRPRREARRRDRVVI